MKKLNLIGQTTGRLTVIGPAPSKHGMSQWVCLCECGATTTISSSSFKKGATKSCGCFRSDFMKEAVKARFTLHGDHKTRLYAIYNGMRKRCYTPSSSAYKNYGAKGIKVSDLWNTFEKFRDWATKSGYSDELTLDRENSDKDYSPDNCRWATYTVQTRNRKKQHKPASSSFIGVSWNKANQKWVAYVTVNRKTHLIGKFDDELVAAKERDKYITDLGLKNFKMNFQ